MLNRDEIQSDRLAVLDACDMILADSDAKPLNYAVGYTRELRAAIRRDDLDNAIIIQCRYVLNNISRWRHANAKHVRETLRNYIEAQ